MNIFGFEISRVEKRRRKSAAYPSANMNRLTDDFPILTLSADGANRFSLHNLRNRSQQLEREKGGIGERYFGCVETNVIGPDGIQLQLNIKNAGKFDRAGSQLIEEAWECFGCRGEFDITREHSAQNFDRISVRASARDGDLLQLIYRGVDNESKIAFQLLEGQYLDENHNVARMDGGNQIRMGVELDPFKRKVAYWILSRHPGDLEGASIYDGRRRRVPAFGLDPASPVHAIHVARTKRPEETRPVPWITPAMDPINMLAGYEEAELVAARAQACKHVFFERNQFAPDGSPLEYGEETASGQLVDDVEPGGTTELPLGYKANYYNPTHPNQAFPEFTKDYRRKIAAALHCSYNTLFTDLEGVNYSSIRAGLLDERDQWKMTQNWYIQTSKQIQFEAWLKMQLILGAFPNFRMTDYDRIRHAAIWKPRRWPWVDPLKDIEAAGKEIEFKLSTRTRKIADHSNEGFEETIDELTEENQYISDKGGDPMLNEPRRSGQLIDSAELPNEPDADIEMVPMSPKERAARQARHPETGQFIVAPKPTPNAPASAGKLCSTPNAEPSQIINFNVEAQKAGGTQPASTVVPPALHLHVDNLKVDDVTMPAKRSFKIIRKDGTVIEGEIEENRVKAQGSVKEQGSHAASAHAATAAEDKK
jgi:lambda family phage portal protein